MKALSRGLPIIALCLAASACERQAPDMKAKIAFFEGLSALCGEQFEGYSSFPTDPDDAFAGKKLVAVIATCDEDEIRIPFSVADDHSRTWILTRLPDGLRLKHDHRHEDGTPHTLTMYGGLATERGSSTTQYFAADDYTKQILPEATTNVWVLTLDTGTLSYELERHAAPRFAAALTLVPEPDQPIK